MKLSTHHFQDVSQGSTLLPCFSGMVPCFITSPPFKHIVYMFACTYLYLMVLDQSIDYIALSSCQTQMNDIHMQMFISDIPKDLNPIIYDLFTTPQETCTCNSNCSHACTTVHKHACTTVHNCSAHALLLYAVLSVHSGESERFSQVLMISNNLIENFNDHSW